MILRKSVNRTSLSDLLRRFLFLSQLIDSRFVRKYFTSPHWKLTFRWFSLLSCQLCLKMIQSTFEFLENKMKKINKNEIKTALRLRFDSATNAKLDQISPAKIKQMNYTSKQVLSSKVKNICRIFSRFLIFFCRFRILRISSPISMMNHDSNIFAMKKGREETLERSMGISNPRSSN